MNFYLNYAAQEKYVQPKKNIPPHSTNLVIPSGNMRIRSKYL